LANFTGRGRKRNGTDIGKTRIGSGIDERGIDLAVERSTDFRRVAWGAQRDCTAARREARHGFGHVGRFPATTPGVAGLATASARAGRLLACSIDGGTASNYVCTCPPMNRSSPPARAAVAHHDNVDPGHHLEKARWRDQRGCEPGVAMLTLPGLAWHKAINSETVGLKMTDAPTEGAECG